MANSNEYEVRCPRCKVSFPIGTKSCLHCGGSTARGTERPFAAPPRLGVRARPGAASRGMRGPTSDDTAVRRPRPFDEPDDEAGGEEGTPGRGGLLRAGVTVLWILLAVGFSVMRACSES